jgi:hypothetical protein
MNLEQLDGFLAAPRSMSMGQYDDVLVNRHRLTSTRSEITGERASALRHNRRSFALTESDTA